MTVRPAAWRDGAAIAGIQARAWRATYRGIVADEVLDGIDEAVTAGRWSSAAEAPPPGEAIFVAERDGRIAGFVAVGPGADDGGAGEVDALYVEPDLQRSGIGRALLEAGVGWLGAAGREEPVLWVLEANEGARRFYERLGWSNDAATKLWRGAVVVRYRRRHADD